MAESQPAQAPGPINRPRLIASIVSTLVLFALLLFIPAGTWGWLRGWLFFAVVVAVSTVISLYLHRVNPEVINARVDRHTGTKRWDGILLGAFVPGFMAIMIVAALDDGRFHWLPVAWWVCGIGHVCLIAGLTGLTWAESVNKFFEPTVRIQTERGHHVIDTGPYAIVRHPGYASAALLILGMPLSLGSYWALFPAAISYGLLIVRTALEDRTLQEELPGYKEYAQRVRYRLVRGLW
jgi:protein-S-isoprenylcysteine O-methyltransferase Ste14